MTGGPRFWRRFPRSLMLGVLAALRFVMSFLAIPCLLLLVLILELIPSSGLVEKLRESGPVRSLLVSMTRFGHGAGETTWIAGIVVLFLGWLLGGSVALYFSQEIGELRGWRDPSIVFDEVAYRLFLTLGGSDNIVVRAPGAKASGGWVGPTSWMRWARWPGILLPFWIALPPLLAWLSRKGEPIAVRRLMSGHYLVLGYGQVGAALANDLLGDRGRDHAVVILDIGVAASRLARVRRAGAIFVEQDVQDTFSEAAEDSFVREFAAHRAEGILVATGNPSRNVDISGRLAKKIAEMRASCPAHAPRRVPRLVPHINDRRLLRWINSEAGNAWLKGRLESSAPLSGHRPSILPFSANQCAARQLLTRRPIAGYARLRGARRVHLVVLGSDPVAEWLIPQAIQAGIAPGLEAPKVTWIREQGSMARADPHGSSHSRELEDAAPALQGYLGIRLVLREFDFDSLNATIFDLADPVPCAVREVDECLNGRAPLLHAASAIDRLAAFRGGDFGDPVTSIFICFDSDERNLDVALQLQDLISRERRWLAPTFVRLYRDSGLDDILSRCEQQNRLECVIDDFGQDERVCTRREMFDPPRDRAARAAHRTYEVNALVAELDGATHDRITAQDLLRRIQAEASASLAADSRQDLKQLRLLLRRHPKQPCRPIIERWLATPPPEPRDRNPILAAWDVDDARALETRKRAITVLLAALGGTGDARRLPPSAARGPWGALDYEYAVSNRDFVDHLPVKLRGVGYRALPGAGTPKSLSAGCIAGPWPIATPWDGYARFFSGLDGASPRGPAESLAAVEHKRYVLERLVGGWRLGTCRDNARRRHPSLVPYERLPHPERQKNLHSSIDISSILAQLHPPRKWYRELRIGIRADGLVTAPEQVLLGSALHRLMDLLLEIEYRRHAGLYGREGALSVRGRAVSAQALQEARRDLAICVVHDLPANRASQATSVGMEAAQAICEQLRGYVFRNMNSRFRTVATSLGATSPSPPSPQPQVVPSLEDDQWEIDLLPEGMTPSVVDAAVRPVWMPQAEHGADLEPCFSALSEPTDAYRQGLEALRARLREEILEPMVDRYLEDAVDWVIAVSCDLVDDGASGTSTRAAPGSPAAAGQGESEWHVVEDSLVYRTALHCGSCSCEIRVDGKKHVAKLALTR